MVFYNKNKEIKIVYNNSNKQAGNSYYYFKLWYNNLQILIFP